MGLQEIRRTSCPTHAVVLCPDILSPHLHLDPSLGRHPTRGHLGCGGLPARRADADRLRPPGTVPCQSPSPVRVPACPEGCHTFPADGCGHARDKRRRPGPDALGQVVPLPPGYAAGPLPVAWAVGYSWHHDLLPRVVARWRVPGWLVGIKPQHGNSEFEGLRRRLEGETLGPVTAVASGRQAASSGGRRRG